MSGLSWVVDTDGSAGTYPLALRSWVPPDRDFRVIYERFPGVGVKAKPQGVYAGRVIVCMGPVRESTAKAAMTKVQTWKDLIGAEGALTVTAGEAGDPYTAVFDPVRLEAIESADEVGPFTWHLTLRFLEVA